MILTEGAKIPQPSYTLRMIFARYCCFPKAKHADFGRVGEAFVNCWIRVRSFAKAKDIAEQNLRNQKWKVLALDEIWRIPQGHFDTDEEARLYYEQALVDREVYVFHLSPRYPVYCVDYEAVSSKKNKRYPQGTHAWVKYWVANEAISSTSDPFDDFWGKSSHTRKAIALGKKAIESNCWRVTSLRIARPVSHRSYPRNPLLLQYYEEAEEYGSCIAFWTGKMPSRPRFQA